MTWVSYKLLVHYCNGESEIVDTYTDKEKALQDLDMWQKKYAQVQDAIHFELIPV
jgi:hypothetical protein